ncbi:uncharacterized protein LOC129307284 [Prosopis cineraria]|uniref:uncharacterized protein LOC129307284 n=1 Tax=Prosopis cineraria TaxID=364024 RepID=UPI002410ADC4|nr:uncharacterized protein LOC129307284 [Prosopis cineraria]
MMKKLAKWKVATFLALALIVTALMSATSVEAKSFRGGGGVGNHGGRFHRQAGGRRSSSSSSISGDQLSEFTREYDEAAQEMEGVTLLALALTVTAAVSAASVEAKSFRGGGGGGNHRGRFSHQAGGKWFSSSSSISYGELSGRLAGKVLE